MFGFFFKKCEEAGKNRLLCASDEASKPARSWGEGGYILFCLLILFVFLFSLSLIFVVISLAFCGWDPKTARRMRYQKVSWKGDKYEKCVV